MWVINSHFFHGLGKVTKKAAENQVRSTDASKDLEMDQSGTVDHNVNQAIETYQNHDSVLRIKERTKNILLDLSF